MNPAPTSASLVVAIITPQQQSAVLSRLHQAGIAGLTVSAVRGLGERADYYDPDRLLAYVRIEIVTDSSEAARLVDLLAEAARSGLPGDGLVFAVPVERAVRIRDGRSLVGAPP